MKDDADIERLAREADEYWDALNGVATRFEIAEPTFDFWQRLIRASAYAIVLALTDDDPDSTLSK